MLLAEEIQKKWAPVLEHADLSPIKDAHRRSVTAQLLENTQRELSVSGSHNQFMLSEASPVGPTNSMGSSSSLASDGSIDTFDPVLISLVRRSMPNLIAYDICGVQPMTGPTGLIFAMRSRYSNQTGGETFYDEVNTAYSAYSNGGYTVGYGSAADSNTAFTGQKGTMPGANSTNGTTAPITAQMTATNTYNTSGGMSTAVAETLGGNSTFGFAEMGFSIEKVTVTAKSRALKAEYSMELAQDLKAIHGLDAESELSNILSAEILAEINREVVRTINITAVSGAQSDTTTAGVFDLDTDSNGRWSVEKFKGLMFQLEREANQIAKQTRRGKGNILLCSSDVASALQMAGVLDYTPALNSNNLNVDDTGATFAGVLNGRLRVYIDPYAIGGNYATMGYKGANAFDAGLFYCPYVPLQMVRAVDPNTFQPKIGFKTRYGMVSNPFADGSAASTQGALTFNTNKYYRRVIINNLM